MTTSTKLSLTFPSAFNPKAGLLVALSGGADSVALLLRLLEEGFNVVAAHCNFHLRGAESDGDEAFVRELCWRKGVRLLVQHFDTRSVVAQTKQSIEMACRELRYNWFRELLKREQLSYIVTAHHADDNVETFLLNLARGTGVRGLTGMKTLQDDVLRPLLSVKRERLRAWLRERGEVWREDSTNADTHYRRNFIRHELLPQLRRLNPSFDENLGHTMRRMQQAEAALAEKITELQNRCLYVLPDGVAINPAPLLDSPYAEEFLFRVLRSFGFPPSVAEDMQRHLHEESGNIYETPTHLATRTLRTIEIRRRPDEDDEVYLQLGENHLPDGRILIIERCDYPSDIKRRDRAYVDADKIKGRLRYRRCRPGDRFAPYGMKGSMLISDYLANRHFSRIDRMKQTLVCDDKSVLWVTCERTARFFAVTPSTPHILRLRFKE